MFLDSSAIIRFTIKPQESHHREPREERLVYKNSVPSVVYILSILGRTKKELGMKMSAIEIDVERICPNLRLIYPSESIEELCHSIQTKGLLEPIQVWFDGEAFRIWDGEKRWRVCKILGITRVKALLVEFK